MARWLSERRREAADGSLHPAYRDGLAPVPGWAGNPRAAADEARWHERLAQLADFRAEGNDWPRHHHYASEREHTLGVRIHTQRYNTAAANSAPPGSSSWIRPFPAGRPEGPGAAHPGNKRRSCGREPPRLSP
jgi:hypothetical protein